MSSIYAGSYKMFVLGKARSSTEFKYPDALYHIVCSAWMCRSWTLQEARLPKHCFFEFASGVHELTGPDDEIAVMEEREEFMRKVPDIEYSRTHRFTNADYADREIRNEFIRKFLDFRFSEAKHYVNWTKDADSLDLIHVWNWLAGGSTTMPEDLYIVLASCLRFKLKQLNNFATPEEKWKSMLFSFPALPFFLFCVPGPRLAAPDQWIPRTVSQDLLHDGSKIHLLSPKISKYFEQGRRLFLELRDDVQLYITSGPVSLTKGYALHSDEDSYQILASNVLEALHLEPTMPSTLCFAVEQRERGALFRVVNHNESGYVLEYACPLSVFDIGDATAPVDYRLALALYARRLSSESKFWVTLEPIVGFKLLQRYQERRPRVGLYHLVASAVAFLFVLFYFMHYAFATAPGPPEPRAFLWWLAIFWLFLTGIVVASVIFLAFAFCGIPVSIPIFSAIIFVYEYVLFWQSYDDNTVIHRIQRYIVSTPKTL